MAYVRALLDSESSESKMRPGECRILMDNLDLLPSQNPVFQLLESRKAYYYFYWMLENPQDIRRFKRKYRKIWEGTYNRLIKLLQNPPVDQVSGITGVLVSSFSNKRNNGGSEILFDL